MRIWEHQKGNKVPWHYDVGLSHGFNLQVKGRKRWFLVSPHTPLPFAAFTHVSAVKVDFTPQDNRFTFYEFETNPGDMVFIPRGWIHSVETLGEINININWLMVPRKPNFKNPILVRECELVKLKTMFSDKLSGDEEIDALVREYIKNISKSAALLRFFKEILKLPRGLYHLPNIVSGLSKFLKGSFDA